MCLAQSLNLKELPIEYRCKDLELEINGTLGAGFPIVEKYIREDGVLVDQSKYSMYWGEHFASMMVEIITFWKESRNEKRAKALVQKNFLISGSFSFRIGVIH